MSCANWSYLILSFPVLGTVSPTSSGCEVAVSADAVASQAVASPTARRLRFPGIKREWVFLLLGFSLFFNLAYQRPGTR
ncbi:unnamed protein product [Prorocentrum cordatum]|uniref:ADP,ATP carrier protein n=1 Tax=Prorocentrum cordatum TaxID=2364126 RepID=A0ABN9RYM3_9DINO|nr:unnamed protein product [Polarella glacialis]